MFTSTPANAQRGLNLEVAENITGKLAQPAFRLLIAGINWPPETFLARLIDGLIDSGVEVTIGSSEMPVGMRDRVKWLRTPSWDASAPLKLARLLVMAVRARIKGPADLKIVARGMGRHQGAARRWRAWNQLLPYVGRRWDIIYFPWNSVSISLLPVFDLPSPVVVSCRGTQVSVGPHNPKRTDVKEGLNRTFAKAAAVHCVSTATMRDACQFGLDPAKAKVIRPAIDPEVFRPGEARRKPDGHFRVVTVGTLIWVKGHEWALKAIRLLVNEGIDVRFDIIGEGPDRQRALYTIQDLGLQKHVRCLGKRNPSEVLKHVQESDVFVLSSLSEGISNAALEAMSCAVPVVTTDCGGMREAVTDGVEGFVVPVRNSEAMAGALQKLASDPNLRKRMGEAGRIRIQREFGLREQIEQWRQLYITALRPIG